MNRRITKAMAEEAASKMKQKAYSKKIEEANRKLNMMGEELVRKYIPAPVIACVNEYNTYFDSGKYASISAVKEYSGGYTGRESYISVSLSFNVPNRSRFITVSREDYNAISKLKSAVSRLDDRRYEFGCQVFDALVALRTEKNIEKELPEALKYISFPEVKAVPMPVFDGLRKIIGSIKEEQS